MNFRIAWICAAVILTTVPAMAQDGIAAKIQGNWQGEFTQGEWEGDPINAQVIATSDHTYEGHFYFGEPSVDTPKVVAEGETKGKRTFFWDVVDLGEARGGEYDLILHVTPEGEMSGAFIHEEKQNRSVKLSRAKLGSPTMGDEPPEGAVLLFDGSNLDKWQRYPEKWEVVDGAFQVADSNLMTKREFGSAKYHIEFRTPFMPSASGQARGNSGVYLMGRYEVQILDSFGLEPADNYCGGIYKQAVPRINACLPPLEWQTYDITFKGPEFDASGNKTGNAHIRVEHNGILIHDQELTDTTPGGISRDEVEKGPLWLQDHGNSVRFRNIWVQPLDN